MELKSVGIIHSELKRIEDCPLQEFENAPMATIEIYPEFREAMTNIKPGSKLILLTWFHLADRSVLTTYPRNDENNPLTGIFSTRSPDRPNPIGMHKVTVEEIHDPLTFTVSQLEVLDQTPLIDIKPDL